MHLFSATYLGPDCRARSLSWDAQTSSSSAMSSNSFPKPTSVFQGPLLEERAWNTSSGRKPGGFLVRCTSSDFCWYAPLLLASQEWAPPAILKGERCCPSVEAQLYPQSYSFSHYSEFMPIGEGTNRLINWQFCLFRLSSRTSKSMLSCKQLLYFPKLSKGCLGVKKAIISSSLQKFLPRLSTLPLSV